MIKIKYPNHTLLTDFYSTGKVAFAEGKACNHAGITFYDPVRRASGPVIEMELSWEELHGLINALRSLERRK